VRGGKKRAKVDALGGVWGVGGVVGEKLLGLESKMLCRVGWGWGGGGGSSMFSRGKLGKNLNLRNVKTEERKGATVFKLPQVWKRNVR